MLLQAAAVPGAAPKPSGGGCGISTEAGKEVASMSKDKKKEPETVDITALADEELDDVVGGADGPGVIMPSPPVKD
jgi:hypothetical protein